MHQVKKLFGEFSPIEPQELSVAMVEGNIGNGTTQGKVIEVQMPQTLQALQKLKEMLGEILDELKDEQLKEFLMAISSSTVLHEGIHGLLDSKPGSRFHNTLAEISEVEDIKAERSTLLDEGLAYALQGIFSKSVEPVGSLEPQIKDSDDEILKKRKILGQKLRPKVEEYLSEGKALDKEFITFASSFL